MKRALFPLGVLLFTACLATALAHRPSLRESDLIGSYRGPSGQPALTLRPYGVLWQHQTKAGKKYKLIGYWELKTGTNQVDFSWTLPPRFLKQRDLCGLKPISGTYAVEQVTPDSPPQIVMDGEKGVVIRRTVTPHPAPSEE